MKKVISIIVIALFVFASCDSGNIIGGRYFGTFHNQTNNLREAGSLSFKYYNTEGVIYFMMNDILSMSQVAEKKFSGVAEGFQLEDLLKTIPAIDSIQVCDSLSTIELMTVEAEFMGNSVKANMTFTTLNDTTEKMVNVEFVGSYE